MCISCWSFVARDIPLNGQGGLWHLMRNTLNRSSMTEKLHWIKYTDKENQRVTPLAQDTFRFPLHKHFPSTLVWKISILSCTVCQACARCGDFAYYILLCLYRQDRKMQICVCNLVLVWKISVSESFTVRCFSVSPKWTENSS